MYFSIRGDAIGDDILEIQNKWEICGRVRAELAHGCLPVLLLCLQAGRSPPKHPAKLFECHQLSMHSFSILCWIRGCLGLTDGQMMCMQHGTWELHWLFNNSESMIYKHFCISLLNLGSLMWKNGILSRDKYMWFFGCSIFLHHFFHGMKPSVWLLMAGFNIAAMQRFTWTPKALLLHLLW